MAETVSGRFQLGAQIARGSMGAVHRGHEIATGRPVAIKLLTGVGTGDGRRLARFDLEVRSAQRLRSQHVVRVLDAGWDPGVGAPFVVMELLEGEDLGHVLSRRQRLPPEHAAALVGQACAGLSEAHALGIVHRDIKPRNLFLSWDAHGAVTLKVLDFGVAKVLLEERESRPLVAQTKPGDLVGSPLYMSPEQARGRGAVDARSDVWALGVVLYECLAGFSPFSHVVGVCDLMIAICSEPIAPLATVAPDVPAALATIAERALSINPRDRYADAAELGRAILALGARPLHRRELEAA